MQLIFFEVMDSYYNSKIETDIFQDIDTYKQELFNIC